MSASKRKGRAGAGDDGGAVHGPTGPSKKVKDDTFDVAKADGNTAGSADDGPCKKVKGDEVKFDNNDESSFEQESNEINPFLLDPVLNIMMSQMTVDDLKTSRHVCQLWDQYSCKELQKLSQNQLTAHLDFKKAEQINEFTKLQNSSNKIWIANTIRTTLRIISAQKQGFFQNLEPKSLTIVTDGADANATLKLIKIFQNSSEYIKEFCLMGSLEQIQFGEKVKWPENLNLPELENFSLSKKHFFESMKGPGIDSLHFIIENVIKNAPKFKCLNLNHQPIDRPLCDALISPAVVEKLQSFGIVYGYPREDNSRIVLAQDLLKMAQAGLKLSKFKISATFQNTLTRDVKLGQLEKLKEFLMIQSDTLEHLKIAIDIEYDYDDELANILFDDKFKMPLLPKLKVLEIEDVDVNNRIYSRNNYHRMNLPSIFPNLREITIDFINFDDLSEIFNGSLDSVKKVTVKHHDPYQDSFGDYTKYLLLESHFPSVQEFEINHMARYKYNGSKKYESIPWKNTLKKLTIHPSTLRNMKFESLSHLKELVRLELINKDNLQKPADFDYKSLAKTSVKSLKISNYLIYEDDLEEIRSRFTLDYIVQED